MSGISSAQLRGVGEIGDKLHQTYVTMKADRDAPARGPLF